MISAEEAVNFELFRDCLSTPLLQRFAAAPAKSKVKRKDGHGRKKSQALKAEISVENDSSNDAEELSEFIDYIATEVFTCLPSDLRTLTYSTYTNTSHLQDRYSLPLTLTTTNNILSNLDPSITDTLTTYGLIPIDKSSPHPSQSSPTPLLHPALQNYLTHLTTAPPHPSQTKDQAEGCEICQREHIPLTYHHLIPKMVHEKAVKRGWHQKDELGNVAWLCRACHSFVHHTWGHEELARELFTMERLLGTEEVRRWAKWVGRVRWKAK